MVKIFKIISKLIEFINFIVCLMMQMCLCWVIKDLIPSITCSYEWNSAIQDQIVRMHQLYRAT